MGSLLAPPLPLLSAWRLHLRSSPLHHHRASVSPPATTAFPAIRFWSPATAASSHPCPSFTTVTAAAATETPPEAARSIIDGDREGSVDWVEATSHFFNHDARPIMLFDGVCNLCNGGVRFVRANDSNGRVRFEALQSDSGRELLQRSGRSPDDISSVVLVEKDRSYVKSDAVLKIMEYLDLPFPQLALFLRVVPWFVRDVVYEFVANNRYNMFGESSDSCEI